MTPLCIDFTALDTWPLRASLLFMDVRSGDPVVRLRSPKHEFFVAYPTFLDNGNPPDRMVAPAWLARSVIVPPLMLHFPAYLDSLPTQLLERELLLIEQWVDTFMDDTFMAQNLALMQKLAGMRIKMAREGLTDEELREVIRDLRQDRVSAAVASATSKEAKAPVDTAALLSAFMNKPSGV